MFTLEDDIACTNCNWEGIEFIETVDVYSGGWFQGCPNCIVDDFLVSL